MRYEWRVPASLAFLAVLVFVAGIIIQSSVPYEGLATYDRYLAVRAIAFRFYIGGGVLTLLAWLSAVLQARQLLGSPNSDERTMKQAGAVLTLLRRLGWFVLVVVVIGVLGFLFLAWAIPG